MLPVLMLWENSRTEKQVLLYFANECRRHGG